MRVAAVALVLVVGAAVVLAFANTLNSWVLGGLLGGLAALLLSIPISLSLFTLLARRHDARNQSEKDGLEDEFDFDDEYYNDALVYEAEGYTLTGDEDFLPQPHPRYLQARRSQSVAGYLPAAREDATSYEDDYEEDFFERAEPRNYPRQPRHPARPLGSGSDELASRMTQRPTQGGSRRQQSTNSLAQHKSAALRKARQEAQQRTPGSTNARSRRSTQESRAQARQRPHTSRRLRPSNPTTTGVQRRFNEQENWAARQERAWRALDENLLPEEEPYTDQVNERYQHYPRRPSYPRRPRSSRSAEPWTEEIDEEYEDEFEEQTAYRTRRDPNMLSGSLRNPLVRRAPYLYDDDPLREEFAQQLGNERPTTRRSSRYEEYEDDGY